MRHRADKDEGVVGVDAHDLIVALQRQAGQAFLAVAFGDFRAGVDLYLGVRLKPLDQVIRHLLTQRFTAHQHVHC